MQDKLKKLSVFTNRSDNQTQFLFNVCEQDFGLLVDLEWYLYNNSNFHSIVPDTLENAKYIMSIKPRSVRVERTFWDKLKQL